MKMTERRERMAVRRERAARLYRAGHSIRHTAFILGVSYTVTHADLTAAGVQLRGIGKGGGSHHRRVKLYTPGGRCKCCAALRVQPPGRYCAHPDTHAPAVE